MQFCPPQNIIFIKFISFIIRKKHFISYHFYHLSLLSSKKTRKISLSFIIKMIKISFLSYRLSTLSLSCRPLHQLSVVTSIHRFKLCSLFVCYFLQNFHQNVLVQFWNLFFSHSSTLYNEQNNGTQCFIKSSASTYHQALILKLLIFRIKVCCAFRTFFISKLDGI